MTGGHENMDPQKILDYGAKLIVIFMCIPIHEYAHAWAATKLGDDTPRYQGRLSLNPLAHLDPIGALCVFLIGLVKFDDKSQFFGFFQSGLAFYEFAQRQNLRHPHGTINQLSQFLCQE